jgi:hypothetical protein
MRRTQRAQGGGGGGRGGACAVAEWKALADVAAWRRTGWSEQWDRRGLPHESLVVLVRAVPCCGATPSWCVMTAAAAACRRWTSRNGRTDWCGRGDCGVGAGWQMKDERREDSQRTTQTSAEDRQEANRQLGKIKGQPRMEPAISAYESSPECERMLCWWSPRQLSLPLPFRNPNAQWSRNWPPRVSRACVRACVCALCTRCCVCVPPS